MNWEEHHHCEEGTDAEKSRSRRRTPIENAKQSENKSERNKATLENSLRTRLEWALRLAVF
jgi:hypothetical protein